MKLQHASRREVKRIAVGTLICDVILIGGLFLLSQFEILAFDLVKVLLGTLCGSVIAVGNFIILCLTIQSAIGMENQRKMKARFQTSYNLRILIQAVWIVIAFFLRSRIHFLAAVVPVFFPKFIILYLQFKGKLLPVDPPSESPVHVDDTDPQTPAES